MLRKLIYGGAATGLGLLFLFGWDAMSYVSTGASCVKDSFKSNVPISFEIQRARKVIDSIDPEVRQNMHAIAREEVEVARLTRQLERLATAVEKGRRELSTLSNHLSGSTRLVSLHGRHYTADQVKLDMSNRLKQLKTSDATMESLQKMLVARQQTLEAARQKLDLMVAKKRQASVEIENLEARRRLLEVNKAASDFSNAFDDSQLAKTQEILSDIETRIQVEEKMISVEGEFQGEIPVDEPVAEDIMEQVTAYLGNGLAEVATVSELAVQ
jgi:chromosome segregation ATPase